MVDLPLGSQPADLHSGFNGPGREGVAEDPSTMTVILDSARRVGLKGSLWANQLKRRRESPFATRTFRQQTVSLLTGLYSLFQGGRAVSVQFGIVCNKCRKLYLISIDNKPAQIQYDRLRRQFKLVCVPPCLAVNYFQREDLMAYIVPGEALGQGYIDVDHCRRVAMARECARTVR
jgi:hypothetical protein